MHVTRGNKRKRKRTIGKQSGTSEEPGLVEKEGLPVPPLSLPDPARRLSLVPRCFRAGSFPGAAIGNGHFAFFLFRI